MTANVRKIETIPAIALKSRPTVETEKGQPPVTKEERIANLLMLSKAELIEMYLKENERKVEANYFIYRSGLFTAFPDFIDLAKAEGGNPWLQ